MWSFEPVVFDVVEAQAAAALDRLEILNSLLGGFGDVEAFKRKMRELEDRRIQLTATIEAAVDPRYRRCTRAWPWRGLIDHIVIPPSDRLLQVVGDFGEMLKASAGRMGGGGCRLCWLRGRATS
jgi:hypothetical protein